MIINGKTIEFNKAVSKYTFDKFETLCLSMPVFISLPEKERNNKINEAYGELTGDVKQVKKPGRAKDSRAGDIQSVGGDIRPEPKTDGRGENIRGKEDKTKIRESKVRSEEKEAKP